MPCPLCIDELASPLGFLRQAFWLRASLRQGCPEEAQTLWIWLEVLSGEVVALQWTDVGDSMADLLPALSKALRVTTTDWPVLRSLLREQWLMPPDYHGGFLRDAPLAPGPDFLREVVARESGAHPTGEKAVPEALGESLGKAASAFVQRLDPLILRQLDRMEPRSPEVRDYNRYAAWPQPQRRYRLQAIWSFPWIDALYTAREPSGRGKRYGAMTSAVDEARKLLPAIEASFGVRPAAIRNLRSLRHLIGGRSERAQALAWALDARGSQRRDLSDAVDLDALLDAFEAFDWLGDRELIQCVARDLDFREARRLVRQLVSIDYPFPERCDDEEQTLVALFGMFAAHPLPTVQERGLSSLRDLLVVDGVARTMFFVRTLVEGLVEAFYALPHISGAGVSWSPILPGPIQVGDLVATELLCTEDLKREGEAMQHCVSGYWVACERGDTHIFSVCHVDGRHVSTIEFSTRRGLLECNQHRAWRNTSPSQQALFMEGHLRAAIQACMESQPHARDSRAPAACQVLGDCVPECDADPGGP